MDEIRVNGHHQIYIPDYKHIYIYMCVCVCQKKLKIHENVEHWE